MSASDRRLFIALLPDHATRAALTSHQQRWHWGRGHPTPAAQLHITLHFLGRIDAAREAALRDVLRGLEVVPFDLTLRTAERWSNDIGVLRPDAHPALLDLHTRIAQRLLGAGIAALPGDYKPHVTLARDAPNAAPPEAFAPIPWTVRDCALVCSRGVYEVVERYGDGCGPS